MELLARSFQKNARLGSAYLISDVEVASDIWKTIRAPRPLQNELTLAVIRQFVEFFVSRADGDKYVVCDPDVLLVGPGIEKVFDDTFDIAITRRGDRRMPYNSGVVFVNNLSFDCGQRFYRLQDEIITELFSKEAGWFGDQLVLTEIIEKRSTLVSKDVYDCEGLRIKIIDAAKYNFSPNRDHPYLLPPPRGVVLYHFKGRCRTYMEDFFQFFVERRFKGIVRLVWLPIKFFVNEWRRKSVKPLFSRAEERVMPSDRK
ncbi:hypothetical protein FZCC0069_05670 [Rhodobacterales bacterium FZCC0069]|nr:hypothetical protein [Rhodobacterales bacterium FZCC0069]